MSKERFPHLGQFPETLNVVSVVLIVFTSFAYSSGEWVCRAPHAALLVYASLQACIFMIMSTFWQMAVRHLILTNSACSKTFHQIKVMSWGRYTFSWFVQRLLWVKPWPWWWRLGGGSIMWLELEVVLTILWGQYCCIWLCMLYTVQLWGHHRFIFVIMILQECFSFAPPGLLFPLHRLALCPRNWSVWAVSMGHHTLWLLVEFRENQRVKRMWEHFFFPFCLLGYHVLPTSLY